MRHLKLSKKHKLLSLVALILFTIITGIIGLFIVKNTHSPGTHCVIAALFNNSFYCFVLSSLFAIVIEIILNVYIKEYRETKNQFLNNIKALINVTYSFINVAISNMIVSLRHNYLVSKELNTEFNVLSTLGSQILWVILALLFVIITIIYANSKIGGGNENEK